MVRILKALVISFSLYSRIPMPQFAWEDEDMKYSLIFFPWVGAVIAGICCGIYYLGNLVELPQIGTILLIIATPLVVTGGFHVDGYMDTCDALNSYGDKERKLEILSDPHVGAFSVIKLITIGLIFAAAFSVIAYANNIEAMIVFSTSFVIARSLSGIGVITLKSAKDKGMLNREAKAPRAVCIVLIVEAILTVCVGFLLKPLLAGVLCASALICFTYYRYKSYKNFGGITGDTAGYFVVICETLGAVMTAIVLLLDMI